MSIAKYDGIVVGWIEQAGDVLDIVDTDSDGNFLRKKVGTARLKQRLSPIEGSEGNGSVRVLAEITMQEGYSHCCLIATPLYITTKHTVDWIIMMELPYG